MYKEPGKESSTLSDVYSEQNEHQIRHKIAELERQLLEARAQMAEMAGSSHSPSGKQTEPGDNDKPAVEKVIQPVVEKNIFVETELALQMSERRYRSLFQSLAEGFVHLELVKDGQGEPYNLKVLDVNPAFESITGLEKKTVVGKTLLEEEDLIDRQMFDRLLQVSLNGEHNRWEEQVAIFDKVLDIRAFCPQPGQCAVVFTDITDRKKVQEALTYSERQMRTMLENLPVGVWLADDKGKIVYGNAAGQSIWAGAKYVGIDEFHEYRGWWVDSGLPILPDEWAVSRAITRGETSLNEVIEIECFDGSRKIINNSAVPIMGEKDEILGAVVVNEDITNRQRAETALKTSEARLRRLVESNIIGVMFLNENGHIWEANDAYLDLVGYSREEMEAGKLWWNQLAPLEYHPRAKLAIEEAKERGACTPYEKEYIRKDGERIPVMIGYALLEGSDSSFVCFALDLSEQKRVEAALQAYASQLEQSNRDLEEFAFVASHDLQEPLRKIEAFGDALIELNLGNLTDQQRDYLARMRNAASRMRRMVDDLLELSRVSTRAQSFEWVNLNQLIDQVLQDLEMSISSNQGRITIGELPTIKADPVQMQQLFQNLVGNAIKFHKPGQPPQVKIYSELAHPSRLNLIVEDNGIGFDEEQSERIFQPFQRLVARSRYEGSGIGLAICRKIVERHRGMINAHSRENQGSTFVVSLPANIIKI
jgi:PAS domain S-box-containing protein